MARLAPPYLLAKTSLEINDRKFFWDPQESLKRRRSWKNGRSGGIRVQEPDKGEERARMNEASFQLYRGHENQSEKKSPADLESRDPKEPILGKRRRPPQ